MPEIGSPRGKLRLLEFWHAVRIPILIASIAAFDRLAEWAGSENLGEWGPVLVAVLVAVSGVLRKMTADTRGRKLLVLLAVSLALSGAAIAADIDAPERVDPCTLVVCKSETPGKSYVWFVTGPRGFEKTFRAADSCVFTGPAGSYLVMMVVSLEDGTLDQGQSVVTIGDAPPGPAPPGPTPPGPTPPPPILPDRFDNVGQWSYQWGKDLGLTSATARKVANDYTSVSAQLAAGGLPSITAANVELRKRRDVSIPAAERPAWDAWGKKVGDVWAKHGVAPKDEKAHHPGVIEFYNAVSAGLGVL